MAGGGGVSLEYTPTWIVAVVCSIIVIISLFAERLLYLLGELFKKKNQKPLFDALQKVKEELMLLGYISLLLNVFQDCIQKICIPPSFNNHMLPCKLPEGGPSATARYRSHFFAGVQGTGRRLLAAGGDPSGHCARKGKVPLMSLEAIHQLHIFIFVLALTHVIFSAATMAFASIKIRQWRQWEDSIQNELTQNNTEKLTHIQQFSFIRDHFKGIDTDSKIHGWLAESPRETAFMAAYILLSLNPVQNSFFKQLYGSVTKSDYTTMRLGFIMTHCRSNPEFNFYKYMVRALETDFRKVVGITWYLWSFVVVFLLLNVGGWHAYFWISFLPVVLLLVVGTKLEHVITQLAQEVAQKHTAIEGDLVVTPSDDHFWFHRPQLILFLIHFILFQSAFEVAIFFWILISYGFDSCIMDDIGYAIPTLVISILVPLVCSYSTLPLYAIVTQMGSSFKKDIFEEHVQEGLVGWAQTAKRQTGQRGSTVERVPNHNESANEYPKEIQLHGIIHN